MTKTISRDELKEKIDRKDDFFLSRRFRKRFTITYICPGRLIAAR